VDKSKNKIISDLKTLEKFVENNSEEVKKKAKQTLLLSEKIHFKYGIAYSKLIITQTHWHLMEYQAGLKVAKDILSSYQDLEDDELLPSILHALALHSWGQAKLFSAQQYWIQALEQSLLLDNNKIEVESLIGLGNIWRMTNNLHEANSTHHIAAKRAILYRIPNLEAKAYILQAWDNYLLENYQAMLPILDKAEKLLTHNTNLTWQAEVYDFKGLALLGLNNLNAAYKCCSFASQLAKQNNLVWMNAHSSISLARIATAQSNYSDAYELLTQAEVIAQQFDKGELRSQICLEQSRIAECTQDYEHALYAYKRYRQYQIMLLQEQSSSLNKDKISASKEQLEIRAKKLIQRIKIQIDNHSISSLSYLVRNDKWFQNVEALSLSTIEQKYQIVVINEESIEKLNTLMVLIHQYCKDGDQVTQLNKNTITLLVQESKVETLKIVNSLTALFSTYPWHRYSFTSTRPSVSFMSLNEFLHDSPFNLLIETLYE